MGRMFAIFPWPVTVFFLLRRCTRGRISNPFNSRFSAVDEENNQL